MIIITCISHIIGNLYLIIKQTMNIRLIFYFIQKRKQIIMQIIITIIIIIDNNDNINNENNYRPNNSDNNTIKILKNKIPFSAEGGGGV